MSRASKSVILIEQDDLIRLLAAEWLSAAGFDVVAAPDAADVPSEGSAEVPSGGSAEVPSGGSAEVPSGGSAEVPSGGSAEVPSGGSVEVPSGGSVDVIIADLPAPRETGAQTLRLLQQSHPGVPVIATSACFHSRVVGCADAAKRLGVARVLAKPYTREQLLFFVQEALQEFAGGAKARDNAAPVPNRDPSP